MSADEENRPLLVQLQKEVEGLRAWNEKVYNSPRKIAFSESLEVTIETEKLKEQLHALADRVEEFKARDEARSNEIQEMKDKIDELEENVADPAPVTSMRTMQQQQHQQQSKGTGSSKPRNGFASFLNRSSTTSDGLALDTFALMMTSDVISWSWLVGLVTFVFQMILIVMIGINQIQESEGSSLFNVPYKVDGVVRTGQLLSIIFCLFRQNDIISSVRCLVLFHNDPYWDRTILARDRGGGIEEKANLSEWILHILIPNGLKALQGLLVLIITCVIIVQSDNIIDLLKDFTALMVLSETDNVVFGLAVNGYLGACLQRKTKEVRRVKINELEEDGYTTATAMSFIYRPAILLLIAAGMISVWIYIVINQENGRFFLERYPDCNTTAENFDFYFNLAKDKFGDGTCYGGPLNTFECGFEGGDCINFNLAFPLCKGEGLVDVQSRVGDGICDMEFNTAECSYDNGDCDFATRYPSCGHIELGQDQFGDGKCYGGPLNTLECEFEGGDCINFNIAYPLCRGNNLVNVQDRVGDGVCNEEFMIKECDYDGGDCCSFDIMSSPLFGDGQCNGGLVGTERCGYDNGDCLSFHRAYPDCPLEQISDAKEIMDIDLGNGICEGGSFSSLECGFEFGDCDVGQLGQDVKVEDTTTAYMGIELSLDGITMAIALPYAKTTHASSGGLVKIYKYHKTVHKWLELGNHPIEGEASGDAFGSSVAMNESGTRIAISSLLGYVKIFDLDTSEGNKWNQIGQTIQEIESDDGTGRNIGMTSNGQRLAIAAPGGGGNSRGIIRIYDLDQTSEPTWEQSGSIAGEADFENIGMIVLKLSSSNGSRVLFNALSNGSSQIRVYQHNLGSKNNWVQIGNNITSEELRSSSTISANGTRIAIVSKTAIRGKVHVYDFNTNDNAWNQIGDAIHSSISSSNENDGFGHSMTMSRDGKLLVISSIAKGCDGTLVPNLDSCAGTGAIELFVYDSEASYYNREYVRVPSTQLSLDVQDHVLRERIRDRERNIFGWRLSMNGDGSMLSVGGFDTEERNGFVKVYDLNQLFYTRCVVYDPDRIGDGVCHDSTYYKNLPNSLNTTECGFEGGDCLA